MIFRRLQLTKLQASLGFPSTLPVFLIWMAIGMKIGIFNTAIVKLEKSQNVQVHYGK
jgi:hypothetical protein